MRQYWALWLDHWARAAHHPNLASWQAQDYRSWRELIAALVAEGVARSESEWSIRTLWPPEVVALIDGLALQTFAELDGLSPETARLHFRAALQARLGHPSAP